MDQGCQLQTREPSQKKVIAIGLIDHLESFDVLFALCSTLCFLLLAEFLPSDLVTWSFLRALV